MASNKKKRKTIRTSNLVLAPLLVGNLFIEPLVMYKTIYLQLINAPVAFFPNNVCGRQQRIFVQLIPSTHKTTSILFTLLIAYRLYSQ